MAAHKVKSYLEKHKIGPLFEDLMAKVIKEMPDEPITFLMQTLKEMYNKKHPEKIRPISPYTKAAELGLTGHPAPKRSQREPQLILPGGGKTVSNTWDSHDLDRLKSNRVSFDEDSKRREYEKPRQHGNKYSKLKQDYELRQSLKNATNKEKPIWNNDTKVPSHDFDEWMRQTNNAKPKETETESKKKGKKPYYIGVKSWADTTANTDFKNDSYENSILRQPVARKQKSYQQKDDLDFSYPIRRKTVSFEDLSSTTTDTESSVSSVKNSRFNAKEQAMQRKKELQNLLTDGTPLTSTRETYTDNRDSSDEAEEIYESVDELEKEGICCKKRGNVGVLKKQHRKCYEDDIQVKICGRCARFMTGEESTIVGVFKSNGGMQRDSNRRSFTDVGNSIATTDLEFESVSQIGKYGKKPPAWPIISDSEADCPTPRTKAQKSQKDSSFLPQKKSARSGFRSADENGARSCDRLDHEYLFSGDTRTYKKNRAKKAGYHTDTETEIGAKSSISGRTDFRFHGARGWSMKNVGTDSEADAEDSDPMAGLNLRLYRNYKSR